MAPLDTGLQMAEDGEHSILDNIISVRVWHEFAGNCCVVRTQSLQALAMGIDGLDVSIAVPLPMIRERLAKVRSTLELDVDRAQLTMQRYPANHVRLAVKFTKQSLLVAGLKDAANRAHNAKVRRELLKLAAEVAGGKVITVESVVPL